MLRKINMIGGGFYHDFCSSSGYKPTKIEWVKDNSAMVSIFVDEAIKNAKVDTSKTNYAWLAESKTINVDLYKWCTQNVTFLEENFELIFTHDLELLSLSNKFKLVICSAKHWVKDVGLHTKSKLISMIVSNKTMCPEHIYRHEIVHKYSGKLDLYGRGFNEIINKEMGLKDYCFSITMENHTYPLAYSEKISDCFAMGVIPIYWGTELINQVFNGDGIIMLNDSFKIEDLSAELYISKKDSIIENYNIAINMPIAEDYIYENYIK